MEREMFLRILTLQVLDEPHKKVLIILIILFNSINSINNTFLRGFAILI